MRRAHQRIVLGIGLVGCVVVLLTAIPLARDFFAEKQWLVELDSTDAVQQQQAAEALGKRGSLEAIPKLLVLAAMPKVSALAAVPSSEAPPAWARESLQRILDRYPSRSCTVLARALQHKDALVRFEAAKRLHSQGPWLCEMKEQVRGALDDPDPRVQMQSLYALWRMGEDLQPLVPQLAAALAARLPAPGESQVLADFDHPFLRMGNFARDALKAHLASSDLTLRRVAVACLGRLDPVSAQIGELLAASCEDIDASVRHAALMGLLATGAVGAVPLKRVLNSMMTGDPKERLAATQVMGLLGKRAGPDAIPFLGEFLRMDWPEILAPAAEALARLSLSIPEATEELRRAIADVEDPFQQHLRVWLDAIDIAQGRDSGDGVLLESIKEQVRQASPTAVAALAWLGREAGDVGDLWLEVEPSHDHTISRGITLASSNTGMNQVMFQIPVAWPFDLQDLCLPVPRLQVRGATAETLQALMQGLLSTDTPQREIAFKILQALGQHLEPLIPDLTGALSNPGLEIRLPVIRLLGGCGASARSAVPALKPLLSAREADLRVAAWEALRKILDTTEVFRAVGDYRS